MEPTPDRINHYRVKVLGTVILLTLLAACQAPAMPAEALPWGDPYNLPTLDTTLDEVGGAYVVASSRQLEDDFGSLLRLEERHYLETSQSRFVVSQKNWFHFMPTRGNSDVRLTLRRSGKELANASLLRSVSLDAIPQTLYISDLLDTDLSVANVQGRACARLTISNEDAYNEPLSMDTCQRPQAGDPTF